MGVAGTAMAISEKKSIEIGGGGPASSSFVAAGSSVVRLSSRDGRIDAGVAYWFACCSVSEFSTGRKKKWKPGRNGIPSLCGPSDHRGGVTEGGGK